MPGMAARNAPHAEPAAAQQAEPADGLEGVMGARGMEPAAGAEERADRPLVTADQADRGQAQCPAHSARRSITICHNSARLGAQLRTRCAAGLRPRVHNEIDSRKSMLVQPKRLPDDAAEAVALHGIAGHTYGNCHAEPRAVLVIATCCHREESVAKAPAARIRGVELRLAPQTLVRRESEPVHSLCAEKPAGVPFQQISAGRAAQRTARSGNRESRSLFRALKGSASAGPWRGDGRAPCGRSGSPCVPGTRACACGALC